MPLTWPDDIDEVLGGDPTAGLAYVTPAGGAVVTAVAPFGLRDREAGTVTFTTSLGFARKLDRIRRNPRVALAFHAREHGFSDSTLYVLVQGTAAFSDEVDERFLDEVLGPRTERFMGPRKTGRLFWDRWLREYYRERVPVVISVERITTWPDLRCEGEPEVIGSARPGQPPEPRAEPRGGVSPRVSSERAARRLARLDHHLLAFTGADGYPTVVPVSIGDGDADGVRVAAASHLLPPGGRRAGLLGHSYRAELVGLAVRQHTGWLEAPSDGGAARYAPHTEGGYKAPSSKTVLLFLNGLLAKRGVRQARKRDRTPAGGE